MFEELTDLELSLLYRAVNTERNLIIMEELPQNQLDAVDRILKEYERESYRRFAHSVVFHRDNGPYGD